MGQACSNGIDSSSVGKSYTTARADDEGSKPTLPLFDNLHGGSILGLSSSTDSGVVFSCSDDCSVASFSWEGSGGDFKPRYYQGHKKAVNR